MSSNSVNSKVKHQETAWDAVIQNAKAQLGAVREREKGLLTVIARFEQFRDEGEPFPVELSIVEANKKAGTAEAIPA